MDECAQIALSAKGKVKINPVVGAIIVKDNRIISRGYHKGYGLKHAEIDAIDNAKESVAGADLYVTLEPCSHYGKTPPCTDTIIKSGIKRVFIGVIDPNPLIAGNGMKILEKNGIEVFLGYNEKICASIIEDFTKGILEKKPYYSLKIAQTLDGKIATETGDSKWITSKTSRSYVHYLRSISDGILIGVNTVLKDDPSLNIRFFSAEQEPYKIILDSDLKIPLSSTLVRKFPDKLIIFTENKENRKISLYEERGIKIIKVNKKDSLLDLEEISSKLFELNVLNVFVEGGSKIFSSFINKNFADKVYTFIAPKFIG
jgi:diaminohydroxyphosphoribosylaminopyrimidine deaminase/5-amino-6-(5-phosphoribosylamino)uracil reductase